MNDRRNSSILSHELTLILPAAGAAENRILFSLFDQTVPVIMKCESGTAGIFALPVAGTA